jgi:uncharacterized protein
MKALVSGASGFVGTRLLRALEARGDSVTRLVRREPKVGEIRWNPAKGEIETDRLGGFDAVFHLAGESIAQRWNPEVKRRIRDSRVEGTRLLAEALAAQAEPPRVIVSASGTGVYGDRGDEILADDARIGEDFLAEVARDWEGALRPLEAAGTRTVALRTGVVLAQGGGAIDRMMLPFKLGLGGPLGSGKQWMPWISLEDLVAVYLFAADTAALRGPTNTVAPHAITSAEFARAFGRALKRPAFLPVPAFALRLLFGEMADAALLSSQRAVPEKLSALGFEFAQPTIQTAFDVILER